MSNEKCHSGLSGIKEELDYGDPRQARTGSAGMTNSGTYFNQFSTQKPVEPINVERRDDGYNISKN